MVILGSLLLEVSHKEIILILDTEFLEVGLVKMSGMATSSLRISHISGIQVKDTLLWLTIQ